VSKAESIAQAKQAVLEFAYKIFLIEEQDELTARRKAQELADNTEKAMQGLEWPFSKGEE
jgi:hypothetical protein